jgi:hypothetical protein
MTSHLPWWKIRDEIPSLEESNRMEYEFSHHPKLCGLFRRSATLQTTAFIMSIIQMFRLALALVQPHCSSQTITTYTTTTNNNHIITNTSTNIIRLLSNNISSSSNNNNCTIITQL